jgi:predicted phosphodiesterase
MKLALVSDSHDHVKNLDSLARFSGEVHFVFGNNEGDRVTISRMAERFPNINIRGEAGILDTGSGIVAWTHLPEFGYELAATGKYVAVFSGHTHKRRSEKVGDTWHINPGELMGLREDPGFAVFDPETGELEYFDL